MKRLPEEMISRKNGKQYNIAKCTTVEGNSRYAGALKVSCLLWNDESDGFCQLGSALEGEEGRGRGKLNGKKKKGGYSNGWGDGTITERWCHGRGQDKWNQKT